jgi:hypothetical protein
METVKLTKLGLAREYINAVILALFTLKLRTQIKIEKHQLRQNNLANLGGFNNEILT